MTQRAVPDFANMPEEEAQQVFTELTNELVQVSEQAKGTFGELVHGAQARASYASEELQRFRKLRDELEPIKKEPTIVPHYRQVNELCRFYAAFERMMNTSAEVHGQALSAIGAIEPTPAALEGLAGFRVPAVQEDRRFLEAGFEMDAATVKLHWLRQLPGIDMVLRAVLGEPAAEPDSQAEEDAREEQADAFHAVLRTNRDLAMRVSGLANELQETRVLSEWAELSLLRLSKLEGASAHGLLRDANWAKLNHRALWLSGLAARLQGDPALAPHFEVDEAVPLPYAR